jgi:hypothetical protein
VTLRYETGGVGLGPFGTPLCPIVHLNASLPRRVPKVAQGPVTVTRQDGKILMKALRHMRAVIFEGKEMAGDRVPAGV